MPVFFNGRVYNSPGVMTAVDDSALANRNISSGNTLVLVGSSLGGEPGKALEFSSPAEAKGVLRGGELLTAVEFAFSPSAQTGGPSKIIAARVNPATQSTLSVEASAAEVLSLKSTDYGSYANQIKVKIETGTSKGKKLTTQFGDDYFSQDDVYRESFSVQYTGAQVTGEMTVSNSSVVLSAPSGNPVATIDLNVYDTVQKLVDFISSQADFTCAVLDGNGAKLTLNSLDSTTNVDIKTASYVAKADLQACVDWFNGVGEGYVTATRSVAAGIAPDNISFTYLAGAIDGVITNNEWSSAFNMLQTEDVQWVVPVTSDASIHAMAETHVSYMSTIAKQERRCLAGGAIGLTVDNHIAAAKALNSDRISMCAPGIYEYNSEGDLTLYAPYMTAAKVAGAFAGVSPGTPMTNKSIAVRGLEFKYKNPSDTDKLINGGVLAVEDTGQDYRVVKSITTWLTDSNYNRVEVSTGVALDFVSRTVRPALQRLVGKKGGPLSLAEAVSVADSTLRELARPEPGGPGVIVGDAENPAYRSISASLEGDVLRVEFQCSPVIPINYVPTIIHAVPFSASAQ